MVKLNKIYTRTGDDGTTGLVDGSRIAKSDALMEAIGDVDEANSALGIAVTALPAGGEAAAMSRRPPIRSMVSARTKWRCASSRARSRGWRRRSTR